MISKLWLTLAHFFDYKPDMNVKFVGASSANGGKPPYVVLVHRGYSVRGGEDAFLKEVLIPQLMALNVSFEVVGLPSLFTVGKYKVLDFLEVAFMFLGLEQWRPSYLEVLRRISRVPATHVIFNNVVPTVSLALPGALKNRGLKTIMWVHNSRLFCANGLSFNGRERCDKCIKKGSRWALIQRCLPTFGQSVLYSWIYRKRRVINGLAGQVDQFAAVSNFAADQVREALSTIKKDAALTTIRHPAPELQLDQPKRPSEAVKQIAQIAGKLPQPFYAYIGRVSHDKGADIFVELAKKYPDKGFLVSGNGPMLEQLKAKAPANTAFTEYAGQEEREWIYRNAGALIIPSRAPNGTDSILFESEPFGTPVVYAPVGGAEETFKWLKRGGCALSEFSGQKFKRTEPAKEINRHEFQENLAGIIGVPVPHR